MKENQRDFATPADADAYYDSINDTIDEAFEDIDSRIWVSYWSHIHDDFPELEED